MTFPGTERQAALLAMVEAVAGPIAERAEQVDRDNVFPPRPWASRCGAAPRAW